MLKIDVHTHILPKNIPRWKEKFGYGGFIELDHYNSCCARMLKDDGTAFRDVDQNCWSPGKRFEECDAAGVNVQVLSTMTVMFSYWTNGEDGAENARFLIYHIIDVETKFIFMFF